MWAPGPTDDMIGTRTGRDGPLGEQNGSPVGRGVIGNTAVSGTVVGGSSPPAPTISVENAISCEP